MLLELPAVELAKRIRRREVSPVEVIDAHIARIEQVNGVVNGLVAERFEAARDEARKAEKQLGAKGRDLPPLLGVPCTIKEFIAVPGMPQTAGLACRRDAIAQDEAVTVTRLRQAGAIVLGVTNVPEGGMWCETYNRIYGQTCNPWDPSRTAGGSSGGEAALVAAAASPLGLGSDFAGSIRIPAAWCGTFGHKPTGRLVPNHGHFPCPAGQASSYMSIGPLARSAADLRIALQALAGPDPLDPLSRAWDLGDPRVPDPKRLVVHYVAEPHRPKVRPEMEAALFRAVRTLQDAGARVEPLELPALGRALDLWSAMVEWASEGEVYSTVVGGGTPVPVFWELIKALLRRSAHTSPALLVMGAQGITRRIPRDLQRWVEAARDLQRELEGALGSRGVLLHPPQGRPAPRHRMPLLRPFDFLCTAMFNVLEMPVTQVPMGCDPRGLPVGVQVAGARGRDHLTIGVAEVLEQAGWRWRPADPPGASGVADPRRVA